MFSELQEFVELIPDWIPALKLPMANKQSRQSSSVTPSTVEFILFWLNLTKVSYLTCEMFRSLTYL